MSIQNYFDGEWLLPEQVTILNNDLGFQRGFGIFETLRARGRQIFHPERHLIRLRRSAELIGLPYPWTDDEMTSLWQTSLEKNGLAETTLKVIVTGGAAEFLAQDGPPRLVILTKPFHTYPTNFYQEGVGVRTSHLARAIPEAKSLSYLSSVMAWRAAQAAGDHEALLIGSTHQILECATANFFIVRGGRLHTAKKNILLGTTRELILELAAKTMEVQQRSIQLDELSETDEAFLTSVNRQIMPVVRVDGQPIGDGTIGPITRQLIATFHDYETRYYQKERL